MVKPKYLLGGILALVIIGIIILSSYIQQKNQIEDQEKNFKETEEKHVEAINAGVKLVPDPNSDPELILFDAPNSQRMESEVMNIAASQEWNKNTNLKYCVRYKSNTDSPNYRSAILYANSSLENEYIFQINIFEYKTDYHCGSWAWAKGGGTYSIDIPFKASFSNKGVFHEICVDDINSQLNHCASEWGISEDDAYLNNIYQVQISSPSKDLGDYTIFDYSKIFVDGNQVSDSLFLNQDLNEFSGLMDDDNPDDFMGWKEYKNAYATNVQK